MKFDFDVLGFWFLSCGLDPQNPICLDFTSLEDLKFHELMLALNPTLQDLGWTIGRGVCLKSLSQSCIKFQVLYTTTE